jgi:hypothetical protein
MAAPDAQTLIASANCYNCYGDYALIKLGLLRQMLLNLNPVADVTPQTLIASANCYNCYGNFELIELGLLAAIINQGLGGGSSQILSYTAANPTVQGLVPPNQNAPAIAYSSTGVGSTYTWNVTTHVWQ